MVVTKRGQSIKSKYPTHPQTTQTSLELLPRADLEQFLLTSTKSGCCCTTEHPPPIRFPFVFFLTYYHDVMSVRHHLPRLSSVAGEMLDLEKTNVLIHTLFVWPIFYTSLLLFHFTPPLLDLPSWLGGGVLAVDLGLAFAVAFGLFYVLMDRRAGSLAAILCVLCWAGSGCLASRLGFSLAWKVVLVAQLFCWTGQFLGHGLFEKRAPALLDNLVQALLTAPFFVLLEVMKNLCGYEPYPGFHAGVNAKIEGACKEWQTSKEKKTW
ncbi:2-hydroxy-palmitic acid dioxygenase mpo1-like isoform X2 [Musa acuminata AAA Group]|uniref:2-hydroxy-palmitic acid dioxygenase mpo1-like isoform X2 n=1 Tax=Musa acuminata AAA Group TaxID=214697 RepID=UPI0031CEC84E